MLTLFIFTITDMKTPIFILMYHYTNNNNIKQNDFNV